MACGKSLYLVAPFAGAWIEIALILTGIHLYPVAPFAGAWIEMAIAVDLIRELIVAPFAGAWIEIVNENVLIDGNPVAPFAGAWIEISTVFPTDLAYSSLRSPERGLKSQYQDYIRVTHSRSVRRSVD